MGSAEHDHQELELTHCHGWERAGKSHGMLHPEAHHLQGQACNSYQCPSIVTQTDTSQVRSVGRTTS